MLRLKRTIQPLISEWLNDGHRKYALFISGVRRCGKTINIEYMLNLKRPNNWIGFDLTVKEDMDFLLDATNGSVEIFIAKLKMHMTFTMNKDTIIFIDEIQENIDIHFFIKRYYDYIQKQGLKNNIIASGSYINSVIYVKRFKALTGTIKSLTMYPLSFYEFIQNIFIDDVSKGENLIELIRLSILNKRPLGKKTHVYMLNMLDKYMQVGGFPVNVITFLNNNNNFLLEVNKYSKELIEQQKIDITYGLKDLDKLKIVETFESVKRGFKNKGNKIEKYKFSYIKNDPSKYKGSAAKNINILGKSGTIIPITRISGDELIEDNSNYKLLYCDMSILNNMVDLDMNGANKRGWVGEHFVGLELSKYGYNPLKYWYKEKENTRAKGYELDYLIKYNYPIEVKYRREDFGSISSLKNFNNQWKPLIISLKDFGDESPYYTNIPMYAIWLIEEYIDKNVKNFPLQN